MELSERIYNGDRAREVLENEVFIAAFDDIEAEILSQWKTSPARDSIGREKLWMLLSLMQKLKGTIVQSLETGKLARLELEHQRTIGARLRDAKSALWAA